MIRSFIHKIALRRHFWRYVTFSEVAELYMSRLMRMLAINISVTFMGVFLFQNGYSFLFILAFWGAFFLFKSVVALPAAWYAARFGPKHGILLSNLLYIPSMIIFSQVPEYGIPAMALAVFFQGLSVVLYDISYLIDFSKVKSAEHAGKQIATMNMIEKAAKGASPVLGGLLALIAGPQIVMFTAAALFFFASAPLFKTAEPTETGRRLSFKGFPWKEAWRSMTAEFAVGFDASASGTIWSLFVAVTVLGIGASNEVYAELGILVSVSLFAALAVSYAFGKLIDKRKGGALLSIGVWLNSAVHISRVFVASPTAVAGINVANEAATTGYMMAYIRGLFDTADISGKRIPFIGLTEVALNLGCAAAAACAYGFFLAVGGIEGIRFFFVLAACVGLGILTSKFRLYRK